MSTTENVSEGTNMTTENVSEETNMTTENVSEDVSEGTNMTTENVSEDVFAGTNTIMKLFSHFLCRVFTGMLVLFIAFEAVLMIKNCHRAPGIVLENFAIHDMAVFHNATATNSTPWKVSSDIDLTLKFKNWNSVFFCFTTMLRMEVSVYYAGNSTISVSTFPLEFDLEPERSLGVPARLHAERFLIMNDSVGSAIAADLRSDNTTLQLGIAAQYLQSDGTIKWLQSSWEVIARTPLEIISLPESLLGKKYVHMKKTYRLAAA